MAVYCRKTKVELMLMLLPSLAGFSLFFVIPFFVCIYYSALDNPVGGGFIGFENYLNLLGNKSFLLSIKNTFIFTSIVVPANMAFSLALAILANSKIQAGKLLRTSIVLPLIVPTVSVALVWRSIFDLEGPLNQFLLSTGLISKGIDYLESGSAIFIAILLLLWKNMGYSFVLFSAGLANIPAEYYDYIRLETRNRLVIFRHITIVYLTPTTFFIFIISIINSFKVFRDLYLISGNYPHDSIYMLQNFINNSFKSLDYGKLTSSAVLTAIVIYVLVLILYKAERKFVNVL